MTQKTAKLIQKIQQPINQDLLRQGVMQRIYQYPAKFLRDGAIALILSLKNIYQNNISDVN